MADYFLKIDGIQGESSDAKHKGEIELVAFSWGVTQSGTQAGGGGGGAGKAEFHDFHFTQRTQKASPLLMLACASGQHIKGAVLTGRKTGKTQLEFLTIKLTDVLVSSFQEGASHETDQPIEEVALNYARIDVTYRPQAAAGGAGGEVKAGWDLKQNKKA
jgi:type VI secretion system secreted protein Hcp